MINAENEIAASRTPRQFTAAHKKEINMADREIPLTSTKLTVTKLDQSHAVCKLCHT